MYIELKPLKIDKFTTYVTLHISQYNTYRIFF